MRPEVKMALREEGAYYVFTFRALVEGGDEPVFTGEFRFKKDYFPRDLLMALMEQVKEMAMYYLFGVREREHG